jgi:hypothetical protein
METRTKRFAGAICLSFLLPGISWSAPEVIQEIYHDTSPPLSSIPAYSVSAVEAQKPMRNFPVKAIPAHTAAAQQPAAVTDRALQPPPNIFPLISVTAGLNFDGVGTGFSGPQGTFTVPGAPSDSNGAVGATQYVEMVNLSFAVFNKSTGAAVMGPVANNTVWSGFGGQCEAQNDGDPVVAYDKAANRWILTQFAVSGGNGNFFECVAVSTTSDATGSYNRYAFSMPNFPDYPKIGVWPDAYYAAFNMFDNNSGAFLGARACAYDRSKMLTGAAATQVCFQLSSTFGGLLPSDLDGSTAPPTSSPNYFLALGRTTSSLDLWKFHVNFTTPASSTFAGPTAIAVTTYAEACGGGTCIPQSGTTTQLDSLGDRLMHRLAYRNFGTHEALVVNHSVTSGSTVGVRWYEIRSPGGTPSVFQQGTYSPTSTLRWMGSVAMDKLGDMAVGYSASSSSMHPAIRYTGRLVTDTAGTLQSENTVITGGGSQNGGLTRWGDYSAITIDPVNDCTFWYVDQYLKTTGSFNWSTRIASFKFPTCQ